MNTLAIVLAGSVIPDEVVCSALGAGLLLGIVNAVIRLVLLVHAPITLFTLGLFLLVLNGCASGSWRSWSTGSTAGFWSAVAALVSAASWVATAFVSDRGRIAIITRR